MGSPVGTRVSRIPAPNGAPNRTDEDHERRIAACLQACDGIPTEQLEKGAILRLVAACIHTTDSEIRAAVESLIPMGSRSDDCQH